MDGDGSDIVEVEAHTWSLQHVDIYLANWGPDDNGKVVDGLAVEGVIHVL